MALLQRLLNILRPAKLDRELEEELAFHREMRRTRALRAGLTPAAADLDAQLRLGNLPLAKDQMRDARVVSWLAASLQDLHHGIVLLRRDSAVSALIILVLALGIGGTTAMFTLLKAAFLDPLPYRASNRLITIAGNNKWNPNIFEFQEIRSRNRTLEQVAFAEHRDMQISGTAEPQRVFAARVSSSFFPLLGTRAQLGRTFLAEENEPGRASRVILSDAFWRSKMGADPHALGKTVRLDGQAAVVIGVLPRGFQFDYPTLRIPEPVDLYVPYPGAGPGGPGVMVARLRNGVTFAQAQDDLHQLGNALVRDRPDLYHDRKGGPSSFTFIAKPLRDAISGPQQSMLWLLLGGAAVLLLIACANTAQLLLARALRRGREIAIRAAVGASRLRLIRQFLLEGVVLAVCGGTLGLLASVPLSRFIVERLPVRSPLLHAAQLDANVFVFTAAVSLLSALVFATIPAVKGSSWIPGPTLNARLSTREGTRWRNAMLALEAALSVFLLCGAGLVAQNLWTLISAPPGFDPHHVLVMRLKLPSIPQDALDATATPLFQRYLKNIAAIPGVDSAATVTGPPMHPSRGGPTELIGESDGAGRLKSIICDLNQVSPGYFRTLAIPLIAGRAFRDDDTAGRPRVAIVNQEFARRFGLGGNIVGRQTFEPDEPFTIVGLAGNVRTRALDPTPVPQIYISSLQFAWSNIYLVVRSQTAPAQLVQQVKAAIESSNADQAVFDVTTMPEMLSDSVNEPRFQLFVIGAFALLAVAMAAAGMYSVIACLVLQRTSEIAVRIALGAGRGDIGRLILGTTAAWVTAGLACGLVFGLASRNTVRALSHTAVQGSPIMYAVVVLFFLLVTVAAAYQPLQRANRLDPAEALRCE